LRTAKWTLPTLLLALMFSGCGGKKDEPDAYASIAKHKAVRIAIDAVNMPFGFGSGTGVQGFDVDIGEQIGKDIGFEVKWVKVSYDRLIDILKNGEAELVISAIPISPELKKEVAFSVPYFDTGLTIARRQDKQQLKDLASLAGKKVGVQGGTTGEKFISTQTTASGVSIVKFRSLDDALGALNRTEIDAVIGDKYTMTYSIFKSFSNLMTLDVRLESEQLGVLVRKQEKKLLAQVNTTVERLKKSGELDALQKKWFQNVIEEAGKQRDDMAKELALKESPKTVNFTLIKQAGASFNFDRLDGFQAQLVGEKGSYTSSPIMTTGNHGVCKFPDAVPPGEYRLVLSIFKLSKEFTIPKVASRNLNFDMNIGSTISIQQK
jgi:glutamine transport system substrate-binding protein